MKPPENRVLALEKAVNITEGIRELDGARVTELADYLDFPQSTVHNHLSTLRHRGLVTKEDDQYQIGLKWLEIGGYAATRKSAYNISTNKVKFLAEKSGERAQFIVEEGGKGYYVATETGKKAVQVDARIGKRSYLHASAAGKSILANLSKERVEEIVSEYGLEQLTENTITDEDDLYSELEGIRDRGYSINDEESIPGLRAIGAAIEGKEGEIVGGLSISGPSSRMKGDIFSTSVPEILLEATNELELELKYD